MKLLKLLKKLFQRDSFDKYIKKDLSMTGNYYKCLDIILEHEGGFVNHPKDPGGMTNKGVTKKVYDKWIGRESTEAEMRGLTFDDVAPIYRKNYWDKIKGDDLPNGLDLCVFDWAVNSGPSRAAKKLQEIVDCTADGAIGPNTLKSIQEANTKIGTDNLIKVYCKKRQDFYESLKTFETFGRGWTRRNKETEAIALSMA